MSPRLLRPRASGIVATDPDARTYISAVQRADASSLEPAVQRAIDDFVKGCKADGIWTAIKASCILMGARTLSGALTPLVGSAPTNNGPFVTGDYDRKTGLVGDGVGKYLDSNRNCNVDPQDNAHMAVWATTVQNEVDKMFMGAGATSNGSSQFACAGDSGPNLDRVGFRLRSSGQSLITGAAVAGLIGMSRAASGSYTGRGGAVNNTISVTSQTPFSGNILVFARNSATNTAGLFGAHRLAWYSIGESLTLSTLESRLSTLVTAIGAATP
jgi:hypothetical protein